MELFPVQKGPEIVGLGGGDAVSAVRVRFGRVVSFSCTLSRLAHRTTVPGTSPNRLRNRLFAGAKGIRILGPTRDDVALNARNGSEIAGSNRCQTQRM